MSRPPAHQHRDHDLESAYRGGVIDFVRQGRSLSAPYAPPYPYAYPMGAPYSEEGCVSPAVYSQAGFPGYPPPAGYPAGYPGVASSYPVYTESMSHPVHTIQAPVKTESPDEIENRINAKIDGILSAHRTKNLESQVKMSSHKQLALESQVNNLTSKLHMLEMKNIRQPSMDLGDPFERKGVSSELSDSDITRRLRKLAAESSKRSQSTSDRIPDW